MDERGTKRKMYSVKNKDKGFISKYSEVVWKQVIAKIVSNEKSKKYL